MPANVDPTMKLSVPSPSSTTGIVKGSVTGTDKDKDALTYVGPIGPTAKGGTVVVDAKGKFTYTPSAQARHAAATADPAAKIDTFTITVDDGHGGIVPVSVTVKISPTNTKPDGAAVALGEPNADGAVVGTVTANDADNDPFTITGPPSTRKGAITYDGGNSHVHLHPHRRCPHRGVGTQRQHGGQDRHLHRHRRRRTRRHRPRVRQTHHRRDRWRLQPQAHPTPPRERSPERSPPGTPTETR